MAKATSRKPAPGKKVAAKKKVEASIEDEIFDRHLLVEKLARQSVKVSLASLGVAFIAILMAWFSFGNTPEPKYFLADDQGRVVALTPASEPFKDVTRLSNWFTSAITKSFTLDFANYRQQLGEARKFYTQAGYDQLIAQIKESGIADALKKGRYLITAAPKSAPVILNEFEKSGTYYYVIRQKFVLTFYVPDRPAIPVNYQIDAMVMRVPLDVSSYGVLINQIIAKKVGG